MTRRKNEAVRGKSDLKVKPDLGLLRYPGRRGRAQFSLSEITALS